jgi:hypothetical protein
MRAQRTAQRTARNHLSKYAKQASEIRLTVKSPAELMAEQANDAADERLVVNGTPLRSSGLTITETPKTPKRKIRGIFDVD